ncbi:MAG: amylo-alpha-1,6-glucosidase [bacterium]
MIPVITESICQNLTESLKYEWLETNGLGGYASSTLHNCNTRKYHGLLVAGLDHPAGRFTLVSKFEDAILTGGRESPLSCNRYPGVIHPDGHLALREFQLAEGPVFLYSIDEIRLRKSILMVQGENTVLIRYDLEQAPRPIRLRLNPLLAFRRHHELKREDGYVRFATTPVFRGFSIHPYEGLPRLFIQATLMPKFKPAPDWYRNIEYSVESERGYDFHEDCFSPGWLDFTLQPGAMVIVCASLAEQRDLKEAWEKEMNRRQEDARTAEAIAWQFAGTPAEAPLPALIRSGRHFPIRTPGAERATIIAGYPWFDDWGRDTLISLPGLTFCSGRTELGTEILKSVALHERDGLIPNCFSADPSQHAYNSIDASLLYFWAIQQYLEFTQDREMVRNHLWPVLKRILTRFMTGTLFDTGMQPDGLLHAGNRYTQLTWMDATSRGEPVTPRHGFAVDLNALWYNALCFMSQMARDFEEPVPFPVGLEQSLREAFVRIFWMEEEGCLADSFADGIVHRSIRPNQILAVSLPFSPLNADQQKKVMETVRRELFTPFGLRTLSPRDPAYQGRYEGDQPTRDSQYHQGTVWPWLLGHYGEGLLKVASDPKQEALALARELQPLLDYSLKGQGLINVPEIFDGDSPQRPNGCPAQAWSSAELIRLFSLFGRVCSR